MLNNISPEPLCSEKYPKCLFKGLKIGLALAIPSAPRPSALPRCISSCPWRKTSATCTQAREHKHVPLAGHPLPTGDSRPYTALSLLALLLGCQAFPTRVVFILFSPSAKSPQSAVNHRLNSPSTDVTPLSTYCSRACF